MRAREDLTPGQPCCAYQGEKYCLAGANKIVQSQTPQTRSVPRPRGRLELRDVNKRDKGCSLILKSVLERSPVKEIADILAGITGQDHRNAGTLCRAEKFLKWGAAREHRWGALSNARFGERATLRIGES
jgi:hypothetical protein